MGETLTSQKMEEINLLNTLKRISSIVLYRILIVEDYILRNNVKKIRNNNFQSLTNSTSHPIEIDIE